MENLEKSPGMCSDRPGTTPKIFDLDVSPKCLREKERGLLMVWAQFGGRRKGLEHISPWVAGPTFLRRCGLSAIPKRTVRL